MDKPLNKLNGWQRLWFVLSVLYLSPVGFFAWTQFPTEAAIRSDWAWAALNVLREFSPQHERISTTDLRDKLYPGLSDEEVIKQIRARIAQKENEMRSREKKASLEELVAREFRKSPASKPLFADLGEPVSGVADTPRRLSAVAIDAEDEKHSQQLRELPRNQLKVIGVGLASWLVPVVLVYVLGAAVGWIYRGFRTKKPPA